MVTKPDHKVMARSHSTRKGVCVCVGEFEVREANVENKSANSDLSRRRRRKHCPRGGFYYYGGVAHPLTKSTVDGLFIEYETHFF